MRLFFSEFPADYDHYHFPYQVLLQREYKDDLARIYYGGFLPFRSKQDLYYLARSTRVKLGSFQPSSENRRIMGKVEHLTFTVEPVEQFGYTSEIQKLCAEFSKHLGDGKPVIPTSAIRKIFTGQANVNQVMTFLDSNSSQPVGYIGLVVHENFVHYAHPFIDITIDDKNLNIGMMTLAVQWAYEQHKQFIYLGTCYTSGSLYKAQFTGFEFCNGMTWSADMEELKYLIEKQTPEYLLQDEQYQEKFGQSIDKIDIDKVAIRVGFK